MQTDRLVFALDIGTRKVAGMVARVTGSGVEIIGLEVREHKTRTMLDGQIHNVVEVARLVQAIRTTLEQRIGVTLTQAGVALAGRSLKTYRQTIDKTISLRQEIDAALVRNLELEAVAHILRESARQFGSGEYYCVGYSVVCYTLDGAVMGNLVGHSGQRVGVEVIATFLPRVVLNSMLNVLRRAGLEATNLTLEPIAAINALIPADARHINIVLIDIGAGTADIAITKNGMIVSYGMVPEAGDEITEALCEKYILDFNTAEQLKRAAAASGSLTVMDLLGRRQECNAAAVVAALQPRVEALARAIAACVLDLNQGPPQAVIMVGGGSLTPGLDKALAQALAISAQQIGVREPLLDNGVIDRTESLRGPDMVTPLGISLMTAQEAGLRFIEVTVNDQPVYILDMRQSVDVLGALAAAGVEKNKLFGTIGRALCVEVNGELTVIRGKVGAPVMITIDGQPAELTTPVRPGQAICLTEATDGQDAQAVVRDVVDCQPLRITLNGKTITLRPRVQMNGFAVAPDEPLLDRAIITGQRAVPARELLRKNGITVEELREEQLLIRVNRQPRIVRHANFCLVVNGDSVLLDTVIADGATVEFDATPRPRPRVRDVVDAMLAPSRLRIILNGQECWIAGAPGRLLMNGKPVGPEEALIDGAEITVVVPEALPPTIANVLPRLAFSPADYKGRKLQITVNGAPAGFTTPLSADAAVQVDFIAR